MSLGGGGMPGGALDDCLADSREWHTASALTSFYHTPTRQQEGKCN